MGIPAEFPETQKSAGITLKGKIRRKNLGNTCGFFSAGKSAGNKEIFSSGNTRSQRQHQMRRWQAMVCIAVTYK
ncbi:hypothetical protein QL285_071187 [Trifolium repens]|nr:hypothetical protein QL285_071187 [Trifolium repens]